MQRAVPLRRLRQRGHIATAIEIEVKRAIKVEHLRLSVKKPDALCVLPVISPLLSPNNDTAQSKTERTSLRPYCSVMLHRGISRRSLFLDKSGRLVGVGCLEKRTTHIKSHPYGVK